MYFNRMHIFKVVNIKYVSRQDFKMFIYLDIILGRKSNYLKMVHVCCPTMQNDAVLKATPGYRLRPYFK